MEKKKDYYLKIQVVWELKEISWRESIQIGAELWESRGFAHPSQSWVQLCLTEESSQGKGTSKLCGKMDFKPIYLD